MTNCVARPVRSVAVSVALSLAVCGAALAQQPSPNAARAAALQALINRHLAEGAQIKQTHNGVIVTPATSINHPEYDGIQAHTNVKLFFPIDAAGTHVASPKAGSPPFTGYGFETPASLACIYRLVGPWAPCNPNVVTTNLTGGSRAIAIVDAYHAPNARADLQFYAAQFGLPAVTTSNFVIWYCKGAVATCNQTTPPSYNSGWEGEISLDVQMAKAMAPNAIIYLVEARSAALSDLLVAVDKASQLVAAQGGGQVSMSWGSGETPSQTSSDSHFTRANVVYFASSGDDPSVSWPSSSPNVISVGGESLSRNPATFDFVGHSAWSDAGTGPSTVYARPAFQDSIAGTIGNVRATPDVSAVANPSTGVWVYISGQGGWNIIGGTSAAAPVFASLFNSAGYFYASSGAALADLYGTYASVPYLNNGFVDVTVGTCGPYAGYWTAANWDWCGGIGVPFF